MNRYEFKTGQYCSGVYLHVNIKNIFAKNDKYIAFQKINRIRDIFSLNGKYANYNKEMALEEITEIAGSENVKLIQFDCGLMFIDKDEDFGSSVRQLKRVRFLTMQNDRVVSYLISFNFIYKLYYINIVIPDLEETKHYFNINKILTEHNIVKIDLNEISKNI